MSNPLQENASVPAGPMLVVAPHLQYPTRDGGNISIDRLSAELSNFLPWVDVVAQKQVIRYRQGAIEEQTTFVNPSVSKPKAGIRTLLRASHYIREKHSTNEFSTALAVVLASEQYDSVLYSYAWTADLIPPEFQPSFRRQFVWTHNNELEWFRDSRKTSPNLMVKAIAYSSELWADKFVARHPNLTYLHVSEKDDESFTARYPGHSSYVIPIGVDVDLEQRTTPLPPGDPIRLVFVGSLGVKMNYDALQLFGDEFFPSLDKEFSDNLEVVVIGSNPSDSVRQICAKSGWELHENVSDEELANQLAKASFTILPFRYASGAKLKLLRSLAAGVPFLSTLAAAGQIHDPIYPCHISDDVHGWISRIEEIRSTGISAETRTGLVDSVKSYSWAESARRILQIRA